MRALRGVLAATGAAGAFLFLFLVLLRPAGVSLFRPDSAVAAAPGATLRVCAGGCPYTSIQDAVDAAAPGDVIQVAGGLYTHRSSRPSRVAGAADMVTQVLYVDKAVTIRGGYTSAFTEPPDPWANPVTLDAQGAGRGLYVVGDMAATIHGLRIINGDATGLRGAPEGKDAGGGLYVISGTTTLANLQVLVSSAEQGGGFFLRYHAGLLRDSLVAENSADVGAGGVVLDSRSRLERLTVRENVASNSGGGLVLRLGAPTLSGSTLAANQATYNGGGLYLWATAAQVAGNTMEENLTTTWHGGGVYGDNSVATLAGNWIRRNTASYGGGVYWADGRTHLQNNMLVDNQVRLTGAGLYLKGAPATLTQNTIAAAADTAGAAIFATEASGRPSILTMTNTVVVRHDVGVEVTADSRAVMAGTLWGAGAWANDANWSGAGSIQHRQDLNAAPGFVDAAAGDYHLAAGSAAVDAGLFSGLHEDVDGHPRPADAGYDVGADERTGTALLPTMQSVPNILNPGRNVIHTVIVSGAGALPATGVQLTVDLPDEQRVVGVTSGAGSCAQTADWGGGATCDLGAVASGAEVTVTLTAQVNPAAAPTAPVAMATHVEIQAAETANRTAGTTMLQDCHAQVAGAPTIYDRVQAAADAASPGGTVRVAGVCYGVAERAGLRQQLHLDKALTVEGGWDSGFGGRDPALHPTLMDAGGLGRVIYVAGDPATAAPAVTLADLRLANGDAAGQAGGPRWYSSATGRGRDYDAGGNLYVTGATLSLRDSTVTGGLAEYGGGIFLRGAAATIERCELAENTASGIAGGGLFATASSLRLTRSVVASNVVTGSSNHGGVGLSLENGIAWLSENRIDSNQALKGFSEGGGVSAENMAITATLNVITGNQVNFSGGALYLLRSHGLVADNQMVGNEAVSGGGLYLRNSDLTVRANVVQANRANYGGGIYLMASPAWLDANLILENGVAGEQYSRGGGLLVEDESHARLHNNVVRQNQSAMGAGVMVADSSPHLANNTIGDNLGRDGSALLVTRIFGDGGRVAMTNTIITGQAVAISVTAQNTVVVSGLLVHNTPQVVAAETGATVTVAHLLRADPGFGADGYHLTAASPAIDRGQPCVVHSDVDGAARPLAAGWDLGADEWAGTRAVLHLPLAMR